MVWLVCDNTMYGGSVEIIDLNTQFSLFITDEFYAVGIVNFVGEEFIVTDRYDTYEDALTFVNNLIKFAYDSDVDEATIVNVDELLVMFNDYI